MTHNEPLKTIKQGVQDIVFKDKGSKFIGFACRVENTQQAMDFFESLKKEHHSANHCCYAYRIGLQGQEVRANDDGEPTHSAGTPILGQIQSFKLTNTAVAVIRYFGGTKLGVGGLIKAYKTTAQFSLEACTFQDEVVYASAELLFRYQDIGLVMDWLKQGEFEILEQKLDQTCLINFKLPENTVAMALNFWSGHSEIKLNIKELY